MHFDVRTASHLGDIDRDQLNEFCRAEMDKVLPRYGEQVRRVEFTLKDLNSHKGGVDKSCLIEITLAGHAPVIAEGQATTVEASIAAAATRISAALDRALGRQRDKNARTPMSGE